MSDFDHEARIPMRVSRCYECGRFYGRERHHNDPGCPHCQKRELAKLRRENATLERSNASYRAATQRRKAARKAAAK